VAARDTLAEGIRIRWCGQASNLVGDVNRSRVGSTPAAFRHLGLWGFAKPENSSSQFRKNGAVPQNPPSCGLDLVVAPIANVVFGYTDRRVAEMLLCLVDVASAVGLVGAGLGPQIAELEFRVIIPARRRVSLNRR
jgi:hypothetical protein